MGRQMSLAVVGADHPNRKGPSRRFEIAMCEVGEPVDLIPEPKNPADPRAVAVYSCRGIQIGYLTAERCGWIGGMIRKGGVSAIFQGTASYGAIIRVGIEGAEPVLPEHPAEHRSIPDADFYPDYIPPDD